MSGVEFDGARPLAAHALNRGISLTTLRRRLDRGEITKVVLGHADGGSAAIERVLSAHINAFLWSSAMLYAR
jgi:hypothetical protein